MSRMSSLMKQHNRMNKMAKLSTFAIFVILALFCLGTPTDAGRPLRILGIFPHPGVSHFDFFRPIMRGLAEVGHHVTVISHFPDKSPPVRYKDLPLETERTLTNTVDLKRFENRPFYAQFIEFKILYEWGLAACNMTLRSNALAEVLHDKKPYDVVIVEQFNSDCASAVAHVLKAPIVGLSSSAIMPWHFERFGIPIIPSITPALFMGYSEEMNFVQRVSNWVNFHALNYLYHYISVPGADAMVRYKFGHDMPSVAEISKEVSLFLVNTHFSLNGVKPLPPSVIEVGGIHIQKAKALPMEIQRWLDNAENGVILISWGSMIRAESMPLEKRDGLLRALKRLKQRVIWKWENDTLPQKPENVLISKWIQQRDILCHPNVKIFMGHAGLMGSSEAVHCGVPMILTPMYGDQFLNAAALQRRGVAVVLPFEEMTENTIMRTIKKALEKPFAENAKAVAHAYNHRPLTPLQTAIWSVEQVARTEGAPLTKSSAVYLSRFYYYSLDVYLFLGTIIFISSYFWICVFRTIVHRFLKPKKLKSH